MAKNRMTLNRCACQSKKVVAELGYVPRTWTIRCLGCGTQVLTNTARRVEAVREWNARTEPTA